MPKPIKLTSEEIALISMIRGFPNQEITTQIKDSVIVSVSRTTKYFRKKGGGLLFTKPTRQPLIKPGIRGGMLRARGRRESTRSDRSTKSNPPLARTLLTHRPARRVL